MLQREQLLGTWSLDAWTVSVGGVQHEPPVGSAGTGQLCYLPDGGMSAIIVGSPGHPGSTSRPDSDLATIRALGGFGYAGSFAVQGAEIHHRVMHSLVPSWRGQTLIRLATLIDGNVLELATPAERSRGGREVINTIRWTRE